MPVVWLDRGLAGTGSAMALRQLRSARVRHRRHDLPRHSDAADGLVLRCLAPGATGTFSTADVQLVKGTAATLATVSVLCPTGTVPLGGGATTTASNINLVSTVPNSTFTGWTVTYSANGNGTNSARVICSK